MIGDPQADKRAGPDAQFPDVPFPDAQFQNTRNEGASMDSLHG
jgi:hypothetical protein